MLKKITTTFATVAIAATALAVVAATGDAFAQGAGRFVQPTPRFGSVRAVQPAPSKGPSGPHFGGGHNCNTLVASPTPGCPVGSLSNPAQARAF